MDILGTETRGWNFLRCLFNTTHVTTEGGVVLEGKKPRLEIGSFQFFFLGSLWRGCGTGTAVATAMPPLHQRLSPCTHTTAATTLEREPLQWGPSCARWRKVSISAAQLLIWMN